MFRYEINNKIEKEKSIEMINNKKSIYPILLLGPIIGKVTENSARIIMEFDIDCIITLEIIEIQETFKKIQIDNISNNKENININTNSDNTNRIININGTYDISKNRNLKINSIGTDKELKLSLSITNECNSEIPVAFQFTGLKENTKYIAHLKSPVIHSHPLLAELECSFKTLKSFKNSNENFRIVFISCNSDKNQRKEIPDQYNLWRNLAEKIENSRGSEVDYIIHIGDQVYLDDGKWDKDEDNCVDRCLALWRNSYREVFEFHITKASEQEEQVEKGIGFGFSANSAWNLQKQSLSKAFIRIISDEYRNTYNNYHQARVLRRVPNLMILDDHDIFDNFTFHIQDTMFYNSFMHFFSEQARFCYYKYQRLLMEDMDLFQDFSKSSLIHEHSWHLLNGIAIFIQDFRGCRSWSRQVSNVNMLGKNSEFFLGNKQQEDIRICWEANGVFEASKAKAAVYVSTTPMVFLTAGAAKLGVKNKIEDCLEQWPLNAQSDQTWILDTLMNYRERTKRNVFIVSGDPHVGVMTKIFKNRKFVLNQVVSSAITQKQPTKTEFTVMSVMLHISKCLSNGYTMEHYKLFRDNNYALIEFRPEEPDCFDQNKYFGYGVYCKHVRSNNKRIKENEYENIGFKYENDRKFSTSLISTTFLFIKLVFFKLLLSQI